MKFDNTMSIGNILAMLFLLLSIILLIVIIVSVRMYYSIQQTKIPDKYKHDIKKKIIDNIANIKTNNNTDLSFAHLSINFNGEYIPVHLEIFNNTKLSNNRDLNIPHQPKYTNHLKSMATSNKNNEQNNIATLITGPNQCGKTKSVQDFANNLNGLNIYIKIDANHIKESGRQGINVLEEMLAQIKKLKDTKFKVNIHGPSPVVLSEYI